MISARMINYLSSDQSLGYLLYIEDYTAQSTQVYGDCSKPF